MIARTAIPITRYRILTKQQAAPTARCVAKGSPGVADPRDRDVAICGMQHMATYGAPRSMLRWGPAACGSVGIGMSFAT